MNSILRKIRLRHFFIAGGFLFLAIWWIALAHERTVKRVVREAPLPPLRTPAPASQSRSPEPPAPENVSRNLDEIRETLALQVKNENESDLSQLMGFVQDALSKDPRGASAWFKKSMRNLAGMPTELSLFFVKAFIQQSPTPVAHLKETLSEKSSAKSSEKPQFFSHSNFSSDVKVNMVKVYALEQMGLRLEREPHLSQSLAALLPDLIEMAKREPDLALAREAAQRVRQIHPNPESVLREIMSSRSKEERFAFEDLRTG